MTNPFIIWQPIDALIDSLEVLYDEDTAYDEYDEQYEDEWGGWDDSDYLEEDTTMTKTEITSTSKLTDVFAALDAQGIYAHRGATQGPDPKAFVHWAAQGKTGLVWFTHDDYDEWDDSRMLVIHFDTTDSERDTDEVIGRVLRNELSRTLYDALRSAGFKPEGVTETSLRLHVPKSRF